MKITKEDNLGTYEISTKTKPIDENDANSIYLALFDNGPKTTNSCRFKVVLSFIKEDGTRKQFIAPILNQFEPGRWLRSVDKKHREQPFYRQAIETKNKIKKRGDDTFHKKFSAGFFYDKETGHKSPHNCAYAYMVWQDNEQPMVGVRFYDYSINPVDMPDNQYVSGRGPKWNKVIQSPDSGMINGW